MLIQVRFRQNYVPQGSNRVRGLNLQIMSSTFYVPEASSFFFARYAYITLK